jgi:integrase
MYLDSTRLTVKPRTLEARERHLRLYVLPELGHVRVDQLTPDHIRRFQQQLLDKPVRGDRTMAVSTARVAMSDFRDMLKYAMDGPSSREYWGLNFDPWPQRRLKWPDAREKPAPHTYAPYSSQELRHYLSATPDHLRPRMLALVCLMLRDGELRGMRWADLKEKRAVYHVRQQHSRAHGMGTTKTETSETEIAVPDVLLDALRQHKKQQAELRLKKGDKWQDNDLIFPTSKGTPLYHNWFCKKVAGASLNEEIAKRAGVRRISEHSLRKTGATILETELGASREIVKAALRHRRDSVTDVYVSYDAESLRPHIDKLAALVTDDLPSTFPQTPPILAASG